MEETPRRIVGLDIGTSKVAAIVGEVNRDGEIEVTGIGSHNSHGLRKGVVVNIDSTVQAIQRATEEAELMSGAQIDSVYAGIAGSHILGINSHGIVAIRDAEVRGEDVDRVIDAARAVAIPADQRVLHVLPQEYLIDHQEGVKEPHGMSGVRLEAKVHVVTCAVNAAQNVIKCIESCNLVVNDLILEQLASSYAVLSDDERDLGVCLVDIGGGTTDIAVYTGAGISHTATIPIAGDQATNDIAMTLPTPTRHAEDIKIKYACALSQLVHPDETINVQGIGDRPPRTLPRQDVAKIVEARYDELFSLIKKELRRGGYDEAIASGIVLTGGAAQLEGVVELAEQVFEMPVNIGAPRNVNGLPDIVRNPIYATGVGLLLYGKEHGNTERKQTKPGGLAARVGRWFRENV